MIGRHGLLAGLLVAINLALLGCRPAAPPAAAPPASAGAASEGAARPQAAAPPPAPVALKAAHANTFAGAPVYLAKQRGYFAAEGIDLDLIPFKVSGDIIPALATGDVDVATSAVNPALFNAILRGVPLKLVADLGSAQPGASTTALVIRKDVMDSGRYRQPADLAGLTIGVPGIYTGNHFLIARIASKSGIALDSINVVAVPMADSLLALRNGSLDGYYDVEPSPSIAVREGFGVKVLTSDEVYPGFQSTVVDYGPSILDRPALAKGFMLAYLRGVRDYTDAFFRNQGREQAAVEIQREGIPVPDDVVPAGIDPRGRIDVSSLEALTAWWFEMGALQALPDVRSMVDEQYVDEALRRLGEPSR